MKKIRELDGVVCISGKAFSHILFKNNEEKLSLSKIKKNKVTDFEEKSELNKSNLNYKEIIKIIQKYGRIFFRMNPNDKIDLVNFYKDDDANIVAMCGDGANDCGALLCSDVGISICHKDGHNITSHFYSTEESISCIEAILKNGRACYENSIIVFKYMILYSYTQLVNTIFLYSLLRDFNNGMYLYEDFILNLIPVLLATRY